VQREPAKLDEQHARGDAHLLGSGRIHYALGMTGKCRVYRPRSAISAPPLRAGALFAAGG
jgi:hypothetical protein